MTDEALEAFERRLKEQGARPYVLEKGAGRMTLNQMLAGQESCLTLDRAGSGVAMMLSRAEMLALAKALVDHVRKK
jgi:hypothetical protein